MLHVQVDGENPPGVVLCDGLGCDGFAWKYLLPQLLATQRVVRWHYRGHGLSPPPPDPEALSVPLLVEDLRSVLDAAGLERPVLIGHSMGVQIALEAHRRMPARVRALVLICGSPGHPLDTFHDTTLLREALPLLRRTVRALPRAVGGVTRWLIRSGLAMEVALALEVNRTLVHREDLVPYFDHLAQMDPRVFVRSLEAVAEHGAEDHLHAVDVPTLVIAGDRDRFTPAWLSRRMALDIPGADWLLVPGGSHTAPLEAPELVWAAIARFLQARVPTDIGTMTASP